MIPQLSRAWVLGRGSWCRLTHGLGPLFSAVYLWEQPEEVTSGPLLSLEEQILNSTFEACDPHKTGGGAGEPQGGLG